MKTVFICPLPPTLNEQIRLARSHWSKSAACKQDWTDKIKYLAKIQKTPHFPDKVWIAFLWEVKSFARDSDNVAAAAKFIMDGLVNAEVLTKDSLMIVQSPVIHSYRRGKKDQVLLTIRDRPIFELKEMPA